MIKDLITPLEVLIYKISKEGPEAHQYELIDDSLKEIYEFINANPEEKESILKQISELKFVKDIDSMIGHMHQKPFGYAGDFMIIDKVYQNHLSLDFKGWDKFAHNQPGSRAVNNRKTFIKNLITEKLADTKSPLSFLNIASGPARDLLEIYQTLETGKLNTTCVEIDSRAIEHAKELCAPHLNEINFLERNVLRFNPAEKHDLVWSAGLFDYFKDKTFVFMINKMYDWLKEGGELVIGNFSDQNPSRPFMEVLADWVLHHRSEQHLINLAIEAGIPRQAITVDQEPLGINLFLRMKKI